MSKFRVTIAALGASSLLMTAAPSDIAEARGLRIGGSPIGIVRSVASLAIGGLRGRHARHVRLDATGASARMNPTRSPDWITRPVARVQVAAGAALAGWHGQRGTSGWWQHGDGGYGWIGPLFWPFAYYDIIDYTLWGDGMGFWGYGYRDIHAAIFTPYDDDELARYVSPPAAEVPRLPSLARISGDDAGELAGLPVEQIRQAMGLSSEERRGMLDDLSAASVQAVATIRTACPNQAASTPTGRLAAMAQRLEAMKSAIARLRTPFRDILRVARRRPEARDYRVRRSARAIRAQGSRRAKLHAAGRLAMAGRRDRRQAAPERHAARAAGRAVAQGRLCQEHGEFRLPAG